MLIVLQRLGQFGLPLFQQRALEGRWKIQGDHPHLVGLSITEGPAN